MPFGYSDEFVQKITDYYRDHEVSMEEASLQFKVSPETLRKHVLARGIPLRNKQKRLSPEVSKDLVEYYRDNQVTMEQTAKKFGTSIETVRDRLQKAGVSIRSSSTKGKKRGKYKSRRAALTPEILKLYGDGTSISIKEVSERVGLSEGVVGLVLHENGVQVLPEQYRRTAEDMERIKAKISETKKKNPYQQTQSHREALERARYRLHKETHMMVVCPGCGIEFECSKKHPRRYHSQSCYLENKPRVFPTPSRSPECFVCGVGLESKTSHYCDEHRPKGGRRSRLPLRIEPCRICGVEVTRPGSYDSKFLYCREHKGMGQSLRSLKRFEIGKEKTMVEGGYELRFLAICYRFQFSFVQFPYEKSLKYLDLEGEIRTYTPDFVVTFGKTTVTVEVKGDVNHIQEWKWHSWRDSGQKLLVIALEELIELEKCSTPEEAEAHLLFLLKRQNS